MRTIRMAALAMCLTACNLYFDDPPRRGTPDARYPDGDKVPPDAFILDGSPCDNGPPDCGKDGGGLPDARVGDGGCNGVDCYPDAGVGDGGCHGGDGGGLPDAAVGDGGCNGDCYPDAGYPDAHH